jgi:hypothetical protein
VSRQLNGWLESLKNSKIKGTKFLTQKERDKIATTSNSKNSTGRWKNFAVNATRCLTDRCASR